MKRESIMALSLVLLLTAMVTACGANSESASSYQKQSVADSLSTASLADRIGAARDGKLVCPFSDECEPAVALISVVTNTGIERCTGFLASDNQVITNDHCVSKSTSVAAFPNQVSNIPCANLIFVHFAKTSTRNEETTVSCQSIQVRSFETGIASKDYTILKLSRSIRDRAPLRLSKRGFGPDEKATILRVQMDKDPRTKTLDGSQNKLLCQASYGTMVYPGVATPNSPLMTFGDCAIQAGNSGSPALNANGEVGAIIQGYISVTENVALKDELRANLIDDSYGQVGIGTQIQCIPEISLDRAANCGSILNMNGLMPRTFVETSRGFDSSVLPQVESNEAWRALSSSSVNEKNFLKVPTCVTPEKVIGAYTTNVMSYRHGINRFLQTEWRSVFEPNEKLVNFTLANGSSMGQVSLQNPDLGMINVPVCGGSRLTRN